MHKSKAARQAVAGAMALSGVGALALLPGAANAAEAGYAEAISCAAVTSVVAGILEAGEPSADDKARAADYEKMAEYWLTSAVGINPGGQEPAFADFDKASRELTDKIAAAKTGEAVSGVLTGPLQVCATFDNPVRKADPVKAG